MFSFLSSTGAQNILVALLWSLWRPAYVHKFLPGDVIGGIGPIKILMHIFQFFGAIICKWLHSFVPQAFAVLFAKELPKMLVLREF